MFLLAQQASYPGVNGFLGTRGSFMLDLVFLAMFAVLPILAVSIALVKRKRYVLHKRVQLLLGVILLAAVTLFELEMRFYGWEHRAEPSPYFAASEKWTCPAGISLIVHLLFAVPTALVWIYVIVAALRRFPDPPQPSSYSARHRFWGWFATIEMVGTAVTGWIFYWLAFAAK